jgi:predicted RNase H-like HicB family nuclease
VEQTFQVILEQEDGVYVTFVPALNFASTHGATREQALERTRELILGYLDTAQKEGIAIEIPSAGKRAEVVDLAISA